MTTFHFLSFRNIKMTIMTSYFGIIMPQLSKCLKFEAVWGVLTDQMIWIWTKRYNKTHACIVVHRMARHNHLIDWYHLLSSFVKLMVIESLKSLSTCVQLRMTTYPSRKVTILDIYSVVTLQRRCHQFFCNFARFLSIAYSYQVSASSD